MLAEWLWGMRLRRVPFRLDQLRDNRNWLAFVGRFNLSAQNVDLIATAHTCMLDQNGLVFGTLYEAQEDISIGPVLGPIRAGQRNFFTGFGSLPQDGNLDYYFEAEDGQAVNLIFETKRGSDVRAAHAKLLNDRLLRPVADSGPRGRELQTVRRLLAQVRKRNKLY